MASIGPAVIRAWQPAWPVVCGGPVGSSLAGVPGGRRWKVSMFTRTRLTFRSDAETVSFHGPAGGSRPVTNAYVGCASKLSPGRSAPGASTLPSGRVSETLTPAPAQEASALNVRSPSCTSKE
jgi:hypothetical protein